MTRLQKKCFAASVGMHTLLLVILIASSAFRSRPVHKDIPLVMTMVNLPITDQEGVGGGSPAPPAPAPAPQPQPLPPQPVAQPQRMTVTPSPTPPKNVEPVEPPKPREPDPEPEPVDRSETSLEPAPKPRKQHREVKPTFDEVTPSSHSKPKRHPKPVQADESDSSSEASASAARTARTRARLAAAMDALASGIKTSGAPGTVVDMPGQGGGQAFIGYETYIYNAYYRAWVTPDSVTDKTALVDVKLVVARDGSILEAEIANRSGDRELDRSVQRALQAVHHLPPFPSSATDSQRSFVLRFNLEAKEGSG